MLAGAAGLARLALLALLALATPRILPAADGSAPAGEARHIDLARYYFASPAEEENDRQSLDAMLAELQGMRGHVTHSARTLLAALELNDRIQTSYGRHDAYLLLRCRIDRTEAGFCSADDALIAAVESRTDFLVAEVGSLPARTLQGFLRHEPGLQPYQFWIDEAQRRAAHVVPESQALTIGAFAPEISGWQLDLYETAVASANFGTVATAQGALDVRRQRNLIAANPDQSVRRQGFEKRYAALASVRGTVAFALAHVAQTGNHLARLRGYANAPDRKYAELGLDPHAVRDLIERVTNEGDLYKRFEMLRVADVERGSPVGVADVERGSKVREAGPWDMDVPLTPIPPVSVADGAALLHLALGSLGPAYQRELDALLDPANGRFDVVPGGAPHRSGGGFSVGYAGATSALFVGTFDGTLKDLSVIAHEGGHAIHRALMNSHGVRPVYTEGPHFMFESFAELNELLLADYLSRHAADAPTKRYYAERFLAVKGLDFLLGAEDAAFEQAVYDRLSEGAPLAADDLDRLMREIHGRFSIWAGREPALASRWEGVSLAFEDPLYSVNYLYASLLALEYFRLYETRREWFLPRYEALLQNGFDDTPQHLLAKFLEIDLDSPVLLQDAVALVGARLAALERAGPPSPAP